MQKTSQLQYIESKDSKVRQKDISWSLSTDSFQARVGDVKRGAIPSLPIHPSIYSDLTLTTHYSNSLTHMPPPTFTWVLLFPRGIKLTGPVWFRQVGCQCSLQAHGEPWIMDLPWVWVPLRVPAAPSPHSCCAWNSQCPINNQWFIKVLTANTRNRKCERWIVNGRLIMEPDVCILFIY